MDYLPAFLDLRGRRCLVVGGGEAAARRAGLLLEAGARVTLVAPALAPGTEALVADARVRHEARAFESADLEAVHLVVAAAGAPATDERVAALARARPLPVNVPDRPDLCSFVIPAIVDRSPVLAAVSTGGAAPVLARHLRGRLETLIPPQTGRLAALAAAFRERVKQRIAAPAERRRFWERVLAGPVAEMVMAGQERAAREALERALADESTSGRADRVPAGEVYLVGAGPGDPDLLTARALRLMQQADVVVHDRLVSPAVLALCRRDAVQMYAGKERDRQAMPQEHINDLLVRLAREGKRVLRLKGGDPFIFGRGGEEIETLAGCGIPFQVVPGITAASGCAAYAGIPLTHRDFAHACVFVTGHLKEGRVNLEWDLLVKPRQTIVIYMGLVGLPVVCTELVRHGMRPDMPAALVQQGTTPEQRVFTGTVETLPGIVERGGARAPTLVIVGEVVTLHGRLGWFEPD